MKQPASMIVRDALVGDDDVPVIAIVSHRAFGSGDGGDPNLVTGSVWTPAVNTPAGATPLKFWIRLPSDRPERALRT